MMKRMITGLLALAFILGCSIPAVAAEKAAARKEKPLWEIISDSFKDFKVREQDKVKGVKKINIFQELGDGIKGGSDNAKNQSLRSK